MSWAVIGDHPIVAIGSGLQSGRAFGTETRPLAIQADGQPHRPAAIQGRPDPA